MPDLGYHLLAVCSGVVGIHLIDDLAKACPRIFSVMQPLILCGVRDDHKTHRQSDGRITQWGKWEIALLFRQRP